MSRPPAIAIDAALVALLVLAPAAMLYPLWQHPASAGEDDVIYYYPLRALAGDRLAAGEWPVGNPREATGGPLLADPQSAVMYPPTWLFAVLPAPRAYALTLFAGFAIAGVGAYAYLRQLRLVPLAACFGATAVAFCGFYVGHRVHWSVLHAGAYLPWGLWCIELLRRRPVAAGAAMVPVGWLMLAAGHWPTVIHAGLVLMAYLFLRGRPLGRSLAIAAVAAALAGAVMAPQLAATSQLMSAATRSRIGYATAGENSFFPASAVLVLFPMLYGSRTPGFYPQGWWGPWHLCETLSYVGLATLAVAAATAGRLVRFRLRRRRRTAEEPAGGPPSPGGTEADRLRPIVRLWVILGAAALVFMLGYYLPTYRLIHMLPVLGVVRCPARMLLAVDIALAVVAAVGVHLCAVGDAALPVRVRRAVSRGLPIAMAGVLALVAVAGGLSVLLLGGWLPFFSAGDAGRRALRSLLPTNPALWVPLASCLATAVVVRWWLGSPRRRAAALVPLLLADLFLVTRFVDVPPADQRPPGPEHSPAAEWVRENAPDGGPWRVWGIGRSYHDRAPELLRPKTAHALGMATINTYGAFQSPAHAHLLAFRIYGTNDQWERLLRRNYLLSGYGVRYVLTAREDVRAVLDGVRVPVGAEPLDGLNLLGNEWRLSLADHEAGTLRLRTPVLWKWSLATQPVAPEAGGLYRIALDARGPDGGAANFLRAELYRPGWRRPYEEAVKLGLTVHAEQIGEDWRHFEWVFAAPDDLADGVRFRVFTMSERPIEVRDISLRTSSPDRPVLWAGAGAERGEKVYRLAAELPAVLAGDPTVAVYENRLALPAARRPALAKATPAAIERLKWPAGPQVAAETLPDVGLTVPARPGRLLWRVTLPAAGVYMLLLATGAAWALRRRPR